MTRRQRQIIEQKRRKRDRIFYAVMITCALMMAACMIAYDDSETREFEKSMEEFDRKMEQIDRQREESGQNAMLERAKRWSEEQEAAGQQDTEAETEAASLYPVFDTMSADWGIEVYEDGFKYYEIPEQYAAAGGYFPEKMQVYTFCLCKQEGVRYALIVAMIERESGYKYDCIGDNGQSAGYMQIMEKWHYDRMEELNCDDLMNPYQNVKVGIDLMKELIDKYGTIQDALTAYNYGERGARVNMWNKGIYVNEYNTQIMNRMHEIEEELGLEEND